MKGHSLMQAIARINRVFQNKTGGLVVDYLGIATDLKNALAFYSDNGGKGNPAENQEDALGIFLEKIESVRNLFAEKSKNYDGIGVPFFNQFIHADFNNKLTTILESQDFIIGLEDGKQRFIREVTVLSQAYALSVPHERALALKDEVAFYQAIKVRLVKFDDSNRRDGRTNHDLETNLRQIMAKAFYSDQVIDLFDAVGLNKPEISILSDEFLREIKGMKLRNTALELLKKLLKDEIKTFARRNMVRSREMLEMLESVLNKYHNNLLTTTEVIEQMIELAKYFIAEQQRGLNLGLTDDELAFYDALETNDSAVKILGDEQLRLIAKEIADTVRLNTKIDWTIRESARADLRRLVKRVLNKRGYPPDKQQKAIDCVLEQAKLSTESIIEFGLEG
jgi:type I restriction enzyme R subunit